MKDLILPSAVEEVVEEELNKLSFLDNHSAEFRCASTTIKCNVMGRNEM